MESQGEEMAPPAAQQAPKADLTENDSSCVMFQESGISQVSCLFRYVFSCSVECSRSLENAFFL